jgi:hypothetical protein
MSQHDDKAKTGPVNEIPKGADANLWKGFRLIRSARLTCESVEAFARHDFAAGAVLAARAAEAYCEGAAILGGRSVEVGL